MGRGRLACLPCDQELPQRVDVSAKDGQAKIPLETDLTAIATTLQTISRLQRADRGFDTWVMLPQLMKCHGAVFQLLRILLGMTRWKAWFLHNVRE